VAVRSAAAGFAGAVLEVAVLDVAVLEPDAQAVVSRPRLSVAVRMAAQGPGLIVLPFPGGFLPSGDSLHSDAGRCHLLHAGGSLPNGLPT
jgi:hypothetical protein